MVRVYIFRNASNYYTYSIDVENYNFITCMFVKLYRLYLFYNATMIVVSNVSSKRIINFPFLLRLFRVNRSLRNNIYLSNLTNIFNSIIILCPSILFIVRVTNYIFHAKIFFIRNKKDRKIFLDPFPNRI